VVPVTIECDMRVETPTLDHYRLDWVPGPGVELGGMWVPGVVTDAAGQDYLGLRGLSDFIPGMTHTVSPFCGFRSLRKSLSGEPDHLYAEYANHDWFEPFQYADAGGELAIIFDSGRVVRDLDGMHWFDADGRWELHGRTVSEVFVLHVPAQPGIDHEVYYRHELLKAQGTVSGTPVEGYLHQDFCYGPPGMTYTQLPIARQLEDLWVSWIHEHDDGTVGGGCFWQGRDGSDFRPGYLLRDGETTCHADYDAALTFDDDGRPTTMRVTVADQWYEFTFESVSGPLHYLGRMTATSSGPVPPRSWCWIEYANGMLTPELLDLMGERFHLVWAR
jgi:hypothetical protein